MRYIYCITLLNGIDAAARCSFLQHWKKINRFLKIRNAKGISQMENNFVLTPKKWRRQEIFMWGLQCRLLTYMLSLVSTLPNLQKNKH